MRATLKTPSIAGQLALMFTLAATLVFAVTGILFHVVQRGETYRYHSREMQARFMLAEKIIARQTDASHWLPTQEKLQDLAPASGEVRYIVESAKPEFRFGAPLPETGIVQETPEEHDTEHDGDFRHFSLNGRDFRTLSRVIPANEARPEVRLTLVADLSAYERTNIALGFALGGLWLLGMAAVALLAWWLARKGLGHVDRLSHHAGKIGPDNLSDRLPHDHLPAELVGLVASFNGTLERLEKAYMQLSTFNADVAHELRTPLGNLIGQTQVALSRERSTDELKDAMQSNLEELERLRSIINDMLFLARADQGELAVNRAPISMADVVHKSAEFLDVLFEEADMQLMVEGDAPVVAEQALLGRAITNLLSNAIQHGTKGSVVRARIVAEGGKVRLEIINEGTGIEPQHLERLFDRFYRVSASRLQSWENHGLGLAIVKAVAAMHGGGVIAQSANGETRIGFTLPQATGI